MSDFVRMGGEDFRNLLALPEKVHRVINILEAYPVSGEMHPNIFSQISSNSQPRFGPKDYITIIESLLDSLYGPQPPADPEEDQNIDIIAGTYILPDRSVGIWHLDCKRISFVSLYPNTMIKLLNSGELVFSIDKMGDLFKDLVEIRKLLKSKALRHYTKSQMLIKVLLNMTYGMFSYNKSWGHSGISCKGMHKVPGYSGKILKDLAEEGGRNIISIDVDVIYLYDINDQVMSALNQIDIPYEIEEVARILWTDKKKYVEFDSSGRIVKDNIGIYNKKYGLAHYK